MARGKGESSVFQRESTGLWHATIELPRGIDNKRRRKTITSKSKKVVLQKLKAMQKDLALHGDLETASLTVAEWATGWLKVAASQLAPNTVSGYRTVVENYIVPYLGSRRLDQLTPKHVRALTSLVQDLPKDRTLRDLPESEWPEDAVMLSSTYALLVHNTLSSCLKSAVNEGRLSANPCDLAVKPKKRVTAERAFTLEEAIQLLRYLSTHPDGVLWATYLLTGPRRGEVLGLEVERVTDILDLSWQLMTLTKKATEILPPDWEHRHLGGQLYLARPKSKAGWRTPPLVDPLATMLKTHIGDRTTGFVFLRDGKPWDPNDASAEWKMLLEDAGLPTDVKLHGLRHTAVDLMYAVGAPEHVITELIGHSSRAMTRAYRTRGDSVRQAQVLQDIGALLTPQKSLT